MSATPAQVREAFSLFDKRGTSRIPSSQVGDLLRALGQNPTQAQVGEITRGLGEEVSLEEFEGVLGREGGWEPAGTVAEFVKAFKVFDKEDSGFIAVGEIKYILTQLGEKMEESEVEEVLKMAEVGADGQVNYESFIKAVLAA